jgi:hypothetical protein
VYAAIGLDKGFLIVEGCVFHALLPTEEHFADVQEVFCVEGQSDTTSLNTLAIIGGVDRQ